MGINNVESRDVYQQYGKQRWVLTMWKVEMGIVFVNERKQFFVNGFNQKKMINTWIFQRNGKRTMFNRLNDLSKNDRLVYKTNTFLNKI